MTIMLEYLQGFRQGLKKEYKEVTDKFVEDIYASFKNGNSKYLQRQVVRHISKTEEKDLKKFNLQNLEPDFEKVLWSNLDEIEQEGLKEFSKSINFLENDQDSLEKLPIYRRVIYLAEDPKYFRIERENFPRKFKTMIRGNQKVATREVSERIEFYIYDEERKKTVSIWLLLRTDIVVYILRDERMKLDQKEKVIKLKEFSSSDELLELLIFHKDSSIFDSNITQDKKNDIRFDPDLIRKTDAEYIQKEIDRRTEKAKETKRKQKQEALKKIRI